MGLEMEQKIHNEAKEELTKLEALRVKKDCRMKKSIADQIKKEGEQNQRVARIKEPLKKSPSKSLSRKRVDARKEEDTLLAVKELPQAESSK